MFGKRIKLFTLFGFEVGIDWSWLVVAVLVAWSLSEGFFPIRYKNLSTQTYWLMGIVGALGLFLSLIFHEMTHSLMARRYGLQMKGITLFIFGGVAEMDEEPPSARAEFMMAVSGPLSSIFLCIVFYVIYTAGGRYGWPTPVKGIIEYLAFINGVLAAFNLVPAFPLDGGRMLRSLLWGWKKNLRWATKISAKIGSGFGILLIIMGIFQIMAGNFIGGMWWFLIGMFLMSAVKMSYHQLLIRKALEGEPVRRFMKTDPVTVSPSLPIDQLVEDYVYKYHYKMFPVVEDGDKLLGCVTTKQIKGIPKEQWRQRKVRDLAIKCNAETTISPQLDAVKALSIMKKSGLSRLVVTEGNRLRGIITLKDLLEFLSVKVELEET